MSNVDSEEIVTVDQGEITVEKSFEPDDFPVPAIAFVIQSERDDSATVRLVERVPDDIEPENVGFHPKYGAEYWDVVDGEIVFERTFAPEESFTTVYGLRGGDADVPAKFLSEPMLEVVETPDSETAVEVSPDGSDEGVDSNAVGDADEDGPVDADEDGSVDAEPVANGIADSDVDIDVERVVEASDGKIRGGTAADAIESETALSDRKPAKPNRTASTAGENSSDRLLDSLSSELTAADPDDPAVAQLRDALGIDLTRTTVEARINHLQSSVSDLEAYTDALEEFLDENGDAERIIKDIHAKYEKTDSRIDDVESTVDDVETTVGDVETAVDEVETKADDVETTVGEMEATVDDVETTVEDVQNTVDDVVSSVDDVETSIESIENRFDTESENLHAEIEELESDVRSLSEHLSEVVEMRDRLAQALGGLSGAEPVHTDEIASAPPDSSGGSDRSDRGPDGESDGAGDVDEDESEDVTPVVDDETKSQARSTNDESDVDV